MRRTARRTAGAALLLFMVAVGAARAQEGPASPPPVPEAGAPGRPAAVLLVAAGEGSGAGIAEVVAGAVRLELERAGLRVVERRASATTPTDASMETLAAEDGAAFAVLARLEVAGREVRVDLDWYDAATARRGTPATVRGKVDLNLDRVVSEGVRKILEREAAHLAAARAAAQAAAQAAAEAEAAQAASAGISEDGGEEAGAAGDGTQSVAGLEDPGDETAAAASAAPGQIPDGPPVPPAPPPGRFELTAGSAVFLTLGEATGYFRAGAFPSLTAAWAVPLRRSLLEIGLSAGVNLFSAEGGLALAEGLLVPLGLDLRWVGTPTAPLSAFLRLGGGPALLGLDPNGTGMRFKTVPFAAGGIGVYLRLLRRAGLVLDSTCLVFFEGSSLIMGFAPGLSFWMRL